MGQFRNGPSIWIPIFTITAFLSTVAVSEGRTLYLDQSIGSSSCTTYSVASRSCGSGSLTAYKTFAGVSAATIPGDTVLVRGGSFSTSFNVLVTGDNVAGVYITYQAYNRSGEPVTITGTGSVPALLIEGKNNIIMDGFTINNVLFWAEIIDGFGNVIRNCSFSRATDSGTRSGLKIIRGENNRILNNIFDDGNDELMIENSNRNLVEGNTFTKARHTLTNISCSNFNVIRNNYYHNISQKIGEEYDCEGVISSSYRGDTQVRKFNSTKHNVWEGNSFAFTKDNSDGGGPYNGIQYAGQNGLVRQNIFYNTQGGGIELTQYSTEANHCFGARIFHNVFYNNTGGGVPTNNTGASSTTFWDNRIVNNIIFRNLAMALPWNDSLPGGSQESHRSTANGGFKFEYNNILGLSPGETDVIFFNGGGFKSLQAAQSQYPQFYANNFEADPLFVDAPNHDFHLNSGSPMIDRGAFLTQATASGSGTVLPVADVGYFYDGYGITGESGDLVQLEGQAQTARVVAIDYASNLLTLDRSMSWSANQGVSLTYNGSAPDLGAYEWTGSTGTRTPKAPGNLLIQ